jgi:O-antigen/teichoic acid export membrane protein
MMPWRNGSRGVQGNRRYSAMNNGSYAVAEYVAQPLGLLLAAPYLLRHLGAAQFGVWMLASAAVSSGSLLSSGFGDAAVKYVAMYRGRTDWKGVARTVRGMLTVNLALSAILGIALWLLSPYAVLHISRIEAPLRHAAIQSFRIGSLLLTVRSIESVFISTLRAVERYRPAVQIGMYSRIGSLVTAIYLTGHGRGVMAIMVATLGITTIGAATQGLAVRTHVAKIVLLPSFHRETISMIAGFGVFSWLQALAAVVFSQVDKLVVGVYLGAPVVAYYAICTQAAQPIHGIVGAGFHVLFPHLSARLEKESLADVRTTILAAFKRNLALIALLAVPVILLCRPILALWMGRSFASQAWLCLLILAASFALLGLNVTAHYALLAMGRVRLVTCIYLVAGAAMLLLMLFLTPRFGMAGAASARLLYGPITWVMYYPLYKMLRTDSRVRHELTTATAWENS